MTHPLDSLARLAYEAYLVVTGGLNYQGLPCPAWDELAPRTREAWRAAADAVRMAVE